MNKISEIKEGISRLTASEKKQIMGQMLVDKSIHIADLLLAYTCCLHIETEKDKTEKRLLADCLAIKYQCTEDIDVIEQMDARSKLLLYPYVNDEFLKENFGHVSKKTLEKAKKFLGDQGVRV